MLCHALLDSLGAHFHTLQSTNAHVDVSLGFVNRGVCCAFGYHLCTCPSENQMFSLLIDSWSANCMRLTLRAFYAARGARCKGALTSALVIYHVCQLENLRCCFSANLSFFCESELEISSASGWNFVMLHFSNHVSRFLWPQFLGSELDRKSPLWGIKREHGQCYGGAGSCPGLWLIQVGFAGTLAGGAGGVWWSSGKTWAPTWSTTKASHVPSRSSKVTMCSTKKQPETRASQHTDLLLLNVCPVCPFCWVLSWVLLRLVSSVFWQKICYKFRSGIYADHD